MTYFFYALATVVLVIGLAWCALILGQPINEEHVILATMAKALALLPGASVVASGLMFLAIAGFLGRLDKIVRANADTTRAVDALTTRIIDRPPPL